MKHTVALAVVLSLSIGCRDGLLAPAVDAGSADAGLSDAGPPPCIPFPTPGVDAPYETVGMLTNLIILAADNRSARGDSLDRALLHQLAGEIIDRFPPEVHATLEYHARDAVETAGAHLRVPNE